MIDLAGRLKSISDKLDVAAAAAFVNSGLIFRAEVTSKAGCGADDFICSSLIGIGTGVFADAVSPFICFVLRQHDGAGASPQGEHQLISAYASATGKFTTAAFINPIDVGDTVLIMHPDLFV
jgi:hypothetical protein